MFLNEMDSNPEPTTVRALNSLKKEYAPMTAPYYLDKTQKDNFNMMFNALLSKHHLPKQPITSVDDAMWELAKMTNKSTGKRKKASASQLYKQARPLGLDNYSSFAGPDQIQHAVQQYGQLKALVRPDDNMLKSRGLNRDGFQSSLRHIVRNSQGQDKYNLSAMAPDPKMYAAGAGALGLLSTAGLGYLGGMDGVGVGMAGTGAGMAAAYMHAANKRQNILNTAKLMKEYGLLKPKTLAHAYPLLSDDHKFASAEEFVSKAAELAVARKS
jgi:hypothetical protein